MIRPVPSVALGRRWHVLAQGLHRLALVAPSPCRFVQAEIWCERTSTSRAKLTTADRAVLATGPPELGLLPGLWFRGPSRLDIESARPHLEHRRDRRLGGVKVKRPAWSSSREPRRTAGNGSGKA